MDVETAVGGCECHVGGFFGAGEGVEVGGYFGEGGGREGKDAGYEFDAVGVPIL